MIVEILLEPELAFAEVGYRLTSPTCIAVDTDDIFIVEEGFETDLASVPSFLKVLIDNDEKGIRLAAIYHDAMYRGIAYCPSRKYADEVFYTIMEMRGLVWWKRQLAWSMVRMLGWRHWVEVPEAVDRLVKRPLKPL